MGQVGFEAVGRRRRRRCALMASVAAVVAAAPVLPEPLNVHLWATTGVTRDENFWRNSVNVEEKDLGAVGLTLELGQERERLLWSLRYIPSFQREFDSPEYSADDHRLELAAAHEFSERSRLRVSERLVRSDVQTDLLSSTSPDVFVIVPQTERFAHALNVTLDRNLGPRNGLELGAVHERHEYETTSLHDGTVYGGSLAYFWRQEDDARLDLLGRLFRHETSDRDANDIASAGVRYRKPLDRWHELTLELGGFQARGPDAFTGDEGTEEGWYGGVGYGWSSGRRATSRVQLRRDVAPLPGVGFSSEADLAQLTSTLLLREGLRLDLVGQGTRHRALFESDEETDTLVAEGRLRWEVRSGLELIAGMATIHQDSDVPNLDNLDYNRYFLGASFPLYRRGRITPAPGVLQPPGPATGG